MKKESYKQENQTFLMFLTCYGKRKKVQPYSSCYFPDSAFFTCL